MFPDSSVSVAAPQERRRGGIDVRELGVAVGVGAALARLAVADVSVPMESLAAT